jgi:hypothetical protein
MYSLYVGVYADVAGIDAHSAGQRPTSVGRQGCPIIRGAPLLGLKVDLHLSQAVGRADDGDMITDFQTGISVRVQSSPMAGDGDDKDIVGE